MPRCIVLHPADNVATLIDPASAGEICLLQGERCRPGHGAAGRRLRPQGLHLAEIPLGAEVLKYGQVIGRATRAITIGEHAHVHNIDSARARGDLQLNSRQRT